MGEENMTKRKARSGKTAFIGIVLLIGAAVWLLTRFVSLGSGAVSGKTDKERTDFIESFGWVSGKVPDKIEEIRIPVEFDEAYEEYNGIQRKQGFDLRKYRAYIAKKYTYSISNYDGAETGVPICANLIVIDGAIVGADISSAKADGFVTVLAKK